MNNDVGAKLGKYRIIRLLGLGGFGDVYLGQHLYLKTPAALKVLHVRLSNDALNGFLQEARTIAHLEHPHIVRILDFGIENSLPYLVMNYAPNGTLRQRYARGSQLPLSKILEYVRQIAEALQYAHDRGVIHRDIKPENLLLGNHGEVLLGDFGLAVVAQSTRYPRHHRRAGTTTYMAPEQLQGHPCYASDQYALGVMMYEWLCGRPPFQGSAQEIATQHVQSLPTPLREVNAALPIALERVVMKAMAKDPDQRFLRVQDFAEAVDQTYRAETSAFLLDVPTPVLRTPDAETSLPDIHNTPDPGVEGPNSPSTSPSALFVPEEKSNSSLMINEATTSPDTALLLQATIETSIENVAGPPSQPDAGFIDIFPSPSVSQPHSENSRPLVPPLPQPPQWSRNRISRRAVMTLGLVGLTSIGGGMLWYNSKPEGTAQTSPVFTSVQTQHFTDKTRSTSPTSTAGSKPHTSTASVPTSTTQSTNIHATPTTSAPSTIPPTSTTAASSTTSTPTPTPTSVPMTPSPPVQALALTVQLANMPAQVNDGATVNVQIVTSRRNMPVSFSVSYDTWKHGYRSGQKMTDNNGNVTIPWNIQVPPGHLNAAATIVATAVDQNGTQVTSAPATVQVV